MHSFQNSSPLITLQGGGGAKFETMHWHKLWSAVGTSGNLQVFSMNHMGHTVNYRSGSKMWSKRLKLVLVMMLTGHFSFPCWETFYIHLFTLQKKSTLLSLLRNKPTSFCVHCPQSRAVCGSQVGRRGEAELQGERVGAACTSKHMENRFTLGLMTSHFSLYAHKHIVNSLYQTITTSINSYQIIHIQLL